MSGGDYTRKYSILKICFVLEYPTVNFLFVQNTLVLEIFFSFICSNFNKITKKSFTSLYGKLL